MQIAFPAPVLNTPDFSFAFGGKDGISIPLNEKGLPFFFEFVALKGMIFDVLEQCSEYIIQVSHPRYPKKGLFIDKRFCCPVKSLKKPQMPPREKILAHMEKSLGRPYVWGGNWNRGIPDLLSLYPPKGTIDDPTKILWTLNGVDCSGLLYEATKGLTPRNTSQLLLFGDVLKVSGLKYSEIEARLQPLDMILYSGHVFFVLNKETTIESRFPFGVIQRNLQERMHEVYQGRNGVDAWHFSESVDQQFIIRRFASSRQ